MVQLLAACKTECACQRETVPYSSALGRLDSPGDQEVSTSVGFDRDFEAPAQWMCG